ncbi:Uncharacterised protein [Serratia rubidaea]|uniref:Uncharacterized protein n=1 Tax=Serratia rubidaea TaxID=61652 RepID=A0A3S4XVD4_SERRU|nr:Uncharacterised protein [Serratia rubidaea]
MRNSGRVFYQAAMGRQGMPLCPARRIHFIRLIISNAHEIYHFNP